MSDSDPHYIVYEGACKLNPRRLIASLLAERDRERLAGVGSQVSALDYLSNASTTLRLAGIGVENLDVFSDENGCSVICFTPELSDTTRREVGMSDIEVCNALITKVDE
ncbi:hypothetical protein GYMLUDRAFT_57770 [Collybiopsis luxurians FD-317 M1]|uniref:Uncharacterized protein n=1 Tax=Collybiopsis luxurians FD-317 M1 TaxID=944289 RepID=A0A0D0CJP6_9AGAR|nr:hypothetical protein GYMLUDRAFT_57770 [Collybiopsis luxurians FD-317 M1]